MTDKYTREQKIERLQELTSMDDYYAHVWLDIAHGASKEGVIGFARSLPESGYERIANITWDVHTGLAFTKLYKALK